MTDRFGSQVIIANLQSSRDWMMTVFANVAGHGFDGDFDAMLYAVNALKGDKLS